jgi:hypothetical protein
LATLLVVGGPAAGAGRHYSFSSNSNVEIMSIQQFGVPDLTHGFTIYGDGRLIGRDIGVYGHAVPENPIELWLSTDDVKAILDTLVDSGLIEFGHDVAKRRREIIHGRGGTDEPEAVAVSGDTAGLSVRVSLASYEGLQRTETVPFVHVASIGNPRFSASQYREKAEAGQISGADPDTFLEAEALSYVYEYLESLVYEREHR